MEVKAWSYAEFPAFMDDVDGAVRIPSDGNEPGTRVDPDIVYVTRDGLDRHLQIIYPRNRNIRNASETGTELPLLPCLVYVQGSAWMKQNCSQDIPQLAHLAERGFVVAVVEYRESKLAQFPAQIHDAQQAVRYMRAHAATYRIDPNKIVMAGSSSGGHTAAFATFFPQEDGTPASALELKGLIDLYGAVSLMHTDGYPTTVNGGLPTSPEGMLMGGSLRENEELRRKGTATEYIDAETPLPPALIVHGTKDRTVNCALSVELYERLRATGHEASLVLIEGADHGGPEFFKPELIDIYADFITRCCN